MLPKTKILCLYILPRTYFIIDHIYKYMYIYIYNLREKLLFMSEKNIHLNHHISGQGRSLRQLYEKLFPAQKETACLINILSNTTQFTADSKQNGIWKQSFLRNMCMRSCKQIEDASTYLYLHSEVHLRLCYIYFYPVISTYFWIAELRILQSILDITLFKDRQVVLNILLLAIVLLDQVSTELTCAEGVEQQMPWYKSWSLMSST